MDTQVTQLNDTIRNTINTSVRTQVGAGYNLTPAAVIQFRPVRRLADTYGCTEVAITREAALELIAQLASAVNAMNEGV